MKTRLLALLLALLPLPYLEADNAVIARGLQDAFANVADKAFPSVVIIKVKMVSRSQEGLRDMMLPPWLQGPERQQQDTSFAMGSGFLFREDGYIITNHHVAGTASEMVVTLHDGREVPAKRIGTDWKTDISVLKINVKDKLPALKFADSDKVKVGHWAIAIGAPYSLGYTMTTGIVSQKGRSVGLNLYEDYIQTDAAINPGNSGGPLLNIDGEVIGVNDFIVGSGNEGEVIGTTGLAFAIPSNLVANVANSIIKNGEVVRPWIGISMQDLDAKLKSKLKVDNGVLVKGVVSGDPADKGGLEAGDIIVKIGNAPVKSSKDVQFGLLKYAPGERIPLTVLRGGATKELSIVAGRQRGEAVAGVEPKAAGGQARGALASFGLILAVRNGYLYIDDLQAGSPADDAGLRPGMLVYAVNKKKVATPEEADKAAGGARRILLLVSDGTTRYLVPLER